MNTARGTNKTGSVVLEIVPWTVKVVVIVVLSVFGIILITVWGKGTSDPAVMWRAIGISLVASGVFSVVTLTHEIVKIAVDHAKAPWSDKLKKTSVLRNPEFWLELFETLPVPAFVKEHQAEVRRYDHIIENKALAEFEKPFLGRYSTDEAIEAAIQIDHVNGDDSAFTNGNSVQLEVRAHGQPGAAKIPILTQKRRISFGGKDYLIGTYTPLMSSLPTLTGRLSVSYVDGQLLFAIPPEDQVSSLSSLEVSVGKAIKLCFRERSGE